MTALRVTVDGETIYPAAALLAHGGGITTDPHAAYFWNGFANPLFTRDVAERICADWTRDGDGDTYTMQPDGRILVDVSAHYPDPADEPISYSEPGPDGLYGTFTCGFCWGFAATCGSCGQADAVSPDGLCSVCRDMGMAEA